MNIELILIIIGAGLTTTGLWLIYPPIALVVLGVIFMLVGWPEGDKE